MSRIRVSWEQLTTGAGDVQTSVTRMDEELATLNTEVTALMAQWDSDAKQAYQVRQQTWDSAGNNIKTALESFKKGLLTAAEKAQATEAENKNRMA